MKYLQLPVEEHPVSPARPIGPKIAKFMHAARKKEARVAADLLHIGLRVIVIVQPVVDHAPLESPVVGPLEESRR